MIPPRSTSIQTLQNVVPPVLEVSDRMNNNDIAVRPTRVLHALPESRLGLNPVLDRPSIARRGVDARPLAPQRHPRAQAPVQHGKVVDPALDIPILVPVLLGERAPPAQRLRVVARTVHDDAARLPHGVFGERPADAVGELGGAVERGPVRENRRADDVVVEDDGVGRLGEQPGERALAGAGGARHLDVQFSLLRHV